MLINIFSLHISTIFLMIAAAAVSLAVYFVTRKSAGEEKK